MFARVPNYITHMKWFKKKLKKCSAWFLKCPSGESIQPLPLHLVGLESFVSDALPLPAQLPQTIFPCIGWMIIFQQPSFWWNVRPIWGNCEKIPHATVIHQFQTTRVKARISWKHGISMHFPIFPEDAPMPTFSDLNFFWRCFTRDLATLPQSNGMTARTTPKKGKMVHAFLVVFC